MSMSCVFVCIFFFLRIYLFMYIYRYIYIKVYAYMSVFKKSSASDIVLLVFVLLVFRDLGDAQRLVLSAAIGLCG